MFRRRFATPCMCVLVLLLLSVAMPSQGQDYPTRPVRIVVPAAPGGSFDALARILAQGLSERWPHRMIVDNRPGEVATSAPERSPKPIPTVTRC